MSTNFLTHWSLLALSLLFVGLSVIYRNKKKNKISILFLCFAALLLRIFVSKDGFLHEWDERYHALVAKNLMDDFLTPMLYKNPLLPYDYKEWASNHIWVHKQPLPLWCMALSLKIFGISAFAIRIPSIILSTILVPVVYEIGHMMYNRKVAYYAAFLCAINGLIIEQSGGRVATDHIDIFFLCLIAFAVLSTLKFHASHHKKYLFFTAIFTACAILSKWLPALIVLPIWGLSANVNKDNWKTILLQLLGVSFLIAIVVTPWQWYIHNRWPIEAAWESSYNRLHIFEALGSEKGGAFYHVIRLTIIFGAMVIVPLLWLFWKSITKKNKNLWILSVWIFIPLLFFSFVKTKMQGYLLFTAPGIFILIAFFVVFLERVSRKSKWKIPARLLIYSLFLLPIIYSVDRLKIREDNSQERKVFKTEYAQYGEKTIIFNEPNSIEAMFYSNCAAAYPYTPSQAYISKLKAEGYRLIIK